MSEPEREAALSDPETESGLDVFLAYVCPFSAVYVLFFSLALLFALFSLLVVVEASPDTSHYYIALLTIPVNGVVLVVTAPMLYLCRHWRRD